MGEVPVGLQKVSYLSARAQLHRRPLCQAAK